MNFARRQREKQLAVYSVSRAARPMILLQLVTIFFDTTWNFMLQ